MTMTAVTSAPHTAASGWLAVCAISAISAALALGVQLRSMRKW
jgi:hypothetical protein